MAVIPSYAPKGTKPTAFAYWWPSDGRGPINNDTMAVLKGAKNPVLAHLFLNHLLDSEAGVLELQLHRLPAAAQRDDPRGGGQEGLPRAQPHQHADPRAAVQERLRPGHAQPGRAGPVGERLGGQSNRRERDRRSTTAPPTGAPSPFRGSCGCCSSSSSPPTRWWRSRWARSTSCSSRSRRGTRLNWNPGWLSKAFSGSLPGGEYWPAVRNTLVYVSRVAGPVLRHRLPGGLLRRTPRQALQDAAHRAAGDPLLGQLPAADAGLDRPPLPRRLRQPDPQRDRHRQPAGLAQRQRLLGDPGARLRLHPVLHPARVRRAWTGSTAARSRPPATSARRRGRPSSGSRCRSADRASWPARRSWCCRCSATTTPTTSSRPRPRPTCSATRSTSSSRAARRRTSGPRWCWC